MPERSASHFVGRQLFCPSVRSIDQGHHSHYAYSPGFLQSTIPMWTVFVRPLCGHGHNTGVLKTLEFANQPTVSDVLDCCGHASDEVVVKCWGEDVLEHHCLIPNEWLIFIEPQHDPRLEEHQATPT